MLFKGVFVAASALGRAVVDVFAEFAVIVISVVAATVVVAVAEVIISASVAAVFIAVVT